MFSKQIKLIVVISVSAIILSGCSSGHSIVFKNKKEQKNETESAISVKNGVIIYKDMKKYDTSIIHPRDKKNDYIFGNS